MFVERRHHLGGHVSIGSNVDDGKVVNGRMISGMVIYDVVASRTGDIRDGKHVASKGGDLGDNGGMTCGPIDEGGVEALGANGVDDVDGGNVIVSCVDRLALSPPLPRPRIGYILTTMDDIGGLMDDPYDVDASSLCP